MIQGVNFAALLSPFGRADGVQLLDNLYFMYFLAIEMSDDVPDSKTIWLFRDKLTKSGVIERLFLSFEARLKALGLIANEGKIVDATFVENSKSKLIEN